MLSEDYLDYPKRRHGMDHDLYPWSNLFTRPPVDWGTGRRLAVVIVPVLEYFPLVPNDGPFRAPGHMVTPYPDLRHYTAREYGTRVGIFRFLKLFETLGIRASVPVNAAIAERYPYLIEAIVDGGHEVIAHSQDMNAIQYGDMDRKVEAGLIRRSLETLRRVSGQPVRGWHSVAQSESGNTLPLLAEAGVDYVCDWVNDDLPYEIATDRGSLVSLPVNHELCDRQMIAVCRHSESQFVEQVCDQADRLFAESTRFGGRMFVFSLTPYIMGLPYRIKALEEALSHVMGLEGAFSASASEIVDIWGGRTGPAARAEQS